MAPSDISKYRPAVLLLAVLSATIAAFLINQRYVKAEASASDTGLHRSNAVRRPNARRRRRADESNSSASSGSGSATVSELAIAHLLARDANDVEYGTFTPSVDMDTLGETLPEFRLIPSQLPSVTDLQSLGSMPEIAARQTQRRIHSEFMYSFMAQEYPYGHLVQGEEADYVRAQLAILNVDVAAVEACIADFNAGRIRSMPAADLNAGTSPGIHLAGTHGLRRLTEPLISADGANDTRPDDTSQALDTRETVADDQSHASRDNASASGGGEDEGQNVMSLVYRVAEDSARRENYVHRGVMCNGCRVQPILGIRYSCANCPDYDLCEDCESHQIHIKTHIFYKVRIPAPLLGYHRPTAPAWYPGKPHLLSEELREKFPAELENDLCRYFNLDHEELQAHWEQFICLAGCSWAEDPIGLRVAIDRDGFDKCFCPPTSLRSPPPNLIYDRMFAFYDTNDDGRIGFEEFLKGLVNLKDTSREAQLRRIFRAYDMDKDGFVCRKDFLRLFRAYYSYSKEMAIASVAAFDPNRDDPLIRDAEKDEARKKVEGGRPISAIFDGSIPAGHASRGGVGKSLSPDANGDLTIVDKNGVLDEDSDDLGDRNESIGDAALGSRPPSSSLRSFRSQDGPNELPHQESLLTHPDGAHATSSASDAAMGHMNGWPPVNELKPEDIFNALGRNVPVEDIINPAERARIIYAQAQRLNAEAANRTDETIRQLAIQDRWRRRNFYTDVEEGATAPPGYVEADSSDDEVDADDGVASPTSVSDSRRQSLRSRSSSKVRFTDDVTDTDYETRSNTSTRSVPVGERWGGYEVREIEKDVGKEALYQAIQQGFNELLDPLFKEKEDRALAADGTRARRRKWAYNIREHVESGHSSVPASRSEESLLHRRQMEGDGPMPSSGENVLSDSPSTSSPDPTMPQNRPDTPLLANGDGADDTTTVSPTTSRTARHAAINAVDAQPIPRKLSVSLSQHLSSPLPPVADPLPSTEILHVWTKHDAIDAEAKSRGGHGKLNFEEFAKKMVEEDPAAAALGRDEEKDEEKEQKWGEKANSGRLWFVGTWIEQSSF